MEHKDNRDNRDNRQEQKILVNFEIREQRVILFDKEGVKLGVIGLPEARSRAQEADLDLVQVAKTEQGMPICKILDFGKWQYQEKKKKHEQELKNKFHELKEMWLSPAISENDFKIKLQKCAEFLADGHKVKITLKVARGKREQYRLLMQNKELAWSLMNNAIAFLKEVSSVDSPVKGGPGGSLNMILKPEKKAVLKSQASNKEKAKPANAPVQVSPVAVKTEGAEVNVDSSLPVEKTSDKVAGAPSMKM